MSEPSNDTSPTDDDSPRAFSRRRLLLALALGGIAFSSYAVFRDELTIGRLAEREQTFLSFRAEHPAVVYGVVFLAYVLVSALAIPLATVLTFVIARLLGFWEALVLVSFASTTGATASFLLSRYIFRDAFTARFGTRLTRFNAALEREGAFYLFALRLNFAVPFFVINVVTGLTPMRVRTFWWVSQVGMLAGTVLYVYVGTQFPSLSELAANGPATVASPGILLAFAVMGLFPFVAKRVVEGVRRGR